MTNPSASRIKILVAEDDDDLRESIVKLFQIFGFQVSSAKDGAEAYELALTSFPSLVLTDVRMPKKGGVELIKLLRATNHDSPKIFAISGFTDSTVAELLHIGADGFFPKPFDASSVRQALNSALLDPLEKWSRPVKQLISHEINMRLQSLSDAQKNSEFLLGRGGFFAQNKFETPRVGEFVKFKIEIVDSMPHAKLEGVGQIVWTTDELKDIRPSGVGVEFKQVDGPGLQSIIEWYKKNKIIPYIPSPIL
jgi:CheY-like chemotaxis protein/Tfp pilus assembly protein PilZ